MAGEITFKVDGIDTLNWKLDAVISRLVQIAQRQEQVMAAIEALRSAQADEQAAITELGTAITTEADQITAVLADLVAAQGNQVTDADVQAAVDAAARIRAAGQAVAGLVPDAPPVP